MKSDYRFGVGWGLALASLTPFDPQPRSPGLKYTRRSYLLGGLVYDEAPYIELIWDALDGEAAYQALLTSLNLGSNSMSPITLYARDERWVYQRYNGRAILPQQGEGANWNFFPVGITLVVRDLVKIS